MGTRCLTVFVDEDETEIVVMYRQFDGSPASYGRDLREFLAGGRLVNGFTEGDMKSNRVVANGVSCLAAQVIAHFKKDVGNIYLYPAGTRDCGEEFVYTVYPAAENIMLRVQAGDRTSFGLPGTKQQNMPVLYDGTADAFDPEQAGAAGRTKRSAGIRNDLTEAVDEEEK